MVGPPGLEPGTKGLCLPLQFSLPVICNPLARNPGTFGAVSLGAVPAIAYSNFDKVPLSHLRPQD